MIKIAIAAVALLTGWLLYDVWHVLQDRRALRRAENTKAVQRSKEQFLGKLGEAADQGELRAQERQQALFGQIPDERRN